MENVQFILYVRSALAPDQRVINMVPANAPILIQEIAKLPKPYPDFLNGSPILTEPRRSKIYRGSEVIDTLQLYLEFIRFHPHALYNKTQMQLIQRDSDPILKPPPALLAPLPQSPPLQPTGPGLVTPIPQDELPVTSITAAAAPTLAPLSPLPERPRKTRKVK